jgi:hypothetical protein
MSTQEQLKEAILSLAVLEGILEKIYSGDIFNDIKFQITDLKKTIKKLENDLKPHKVEFYGI